MSSFGRWMTGDPGCDLSALHSLLMKSIEQQLVTMYGTCSAG